MKAVVLAYHNIGCTGIQALIRQGIDIAAVFTHRDDPTEAVWFDSVAELSSTLGIPVFAPENINHPLWVERIRAMTPDILFSFYYREMVKREILDIPPRECLNLHGSLLPRYRGRCPINWVLVNGEAETGVSLHYMTPRPDDGDIVGQRRIPIGSDDTALSLAPQGYHGNRGTAGRTVARHHRRQRPHERPRITPEPPISAAGDRRTVRSTGSSRQRW